MPPELICEILRYLADQDKLQCYQVHPCFHVLTDLEVYELALGFDRIDDTILGNLSSASLIKLVKKYSGTPRKFYCSNCQCYRHELKNRWQDFFFLEASCSYCHVQGCYSRDNYSCLAKTGFKCFFCNEFTTTFRCEDCMATAMKINWGNHLHRYDSCGCWGPP